jgi:hypothetical protein
MYRYIYLHRTIMCRGQAQPTEPLVLMEETGGLGENH